MNPDIIMVSDNYKNTLTQSLKLRDIAFNIGEDENLKLIVFNQKNTYGLEKEITGIEIINLNLNKKNPDSNDISIALSIFLKNKDFKYLCFEHSLKASETAGLTAGKLPCTIISGINRYKKGPVFTRQIFNSKLEENIIPLKKQNILTFYPESFKPLKMKSDKKEVKNIEINISVEKTRCLESFSRTKTSSLDNAEIILSAGRGFKNQEELEKIFQLSKLIPGSAVGCSRPLVDSGMLEYSRQIGITGTIVKPKIYAALGISGSSQHIYGMKNSEFIISVNNDPNASIFNYSDICIQEDIISFIDILIKKLENKK
ncbi:MAG: hypothetical protein CSA18_01755 [Deltaproteobacteria bacterium]|nr:MAG: hypothetical protein CSA18_01755 [Deltaproteobacteria bacterium]